MSCHVGIDPRYGIVSAYNEITKENISISDDLFVSDLLKPLLIKENDVDKVDAMFEKIKSEVNGTLGCVCFCLDSSYGNEIRQQFIEKANQHGALQIQLICIYAHSYLARILQPDWFIKSSRNLPDSKFSDYRPKNCDIIWISTENNFVYEIVNKKARMVKELKNFSMERDLIKIKQDFDVQPNVIIFNGDESIFEQIGKVFSESRLILVQSYDEGPEATALLKARIMAKDPQILEYDVYTHLDMDVAFEINGKKITTLEKGPFLPLEKTFNVLVETDLIKLQVVCDDEKHSIMFSKEMKATSEMLMAGETSITFKIDSNRIFSFDFSHSTNVWAFQKLYDIPQKIKYNVEKIFAVGIDLGTSRCCADVNRKNGIETVALDNTGERLLPSSSSTTLTIFIK